MRFLSTNDVNEAYEILKNNGILAFPTETVYGLGILANSKENLDKLVKVKNRPLDKPFTLMCSNVEQVKKYLEDNDVFDKLANAFFPGEITLVTKAKSGVPYYLDLGTGYIGVRIPNNKFILEVIDKLSEPLFVPSANISNEAPALNAKEVYEYFKDEIDGIVEGEVGSKVPSTVVKIVGKDIEITRVGKITKDEILEVIK